MLIIQGTGMPTCPKDFLRAYESVPNRPHEISNGSDLLHGAVAPRGVPTTNVHSKRPQLVLEMGGQNDCPCKPYLSIGGEKFAWAAPAPFKTPSPFTIEFLLLHYYVVCQFMLSSN